MAIERGLVREVAHARSAVEFARDGWARGGGSAAVVRCEVLVQRGPVAAERAAGPTCDVVRVGG